MATKTNKGFIILRHNILSNTTELQAEAALEKDYEANYQLKFKHIEITSVEKQLIEHSNLNHTDWNREAVHQKEVFIKQIKPVIEKYPDYDIIYFGAAPIPLALHLGSLLGTWQAVTIYLKNHNGDKEWYQRNPSGSTTAKHKVISRGIPKEENNSMEDVLIDIQTSYKIDEEEVHDSIQNNLAKEIHIGLEELVLDLSDHKYAIEVADQFSYALKQLSNNLKRIDTIHLVVSAPVGLAFLLGTHISANVHQGIQTYQYNTNNEFKYTPVLVIGQATETPLSLSKEEHQAITKQKELFKTKEWKQVQAFIKTVQKGKKDKDAWYKVVLEKGAKIFDYHLWNGLPQIGATPLWDSSFVDIEKVEGGFKYFTEDNTWGLDQDLVYYISSNLDKEDGRTFRALRMLFFHEGMHYWSHHLHSYSAEGIGRFPKVLEAADYQADVWAMLHEYAYSEIYHSDEIDQANSGAFFVKMIESALATMWAFDDRGIELTQIQIRRMNRYLIWYWQLLQIEDKRCNSLEKILKVLTQLPVIEIKGLIPKVEGYRVFHRLDRFVETNLEFGVLWKNQIKRIGNIGYFNIPDLIQAFRDRDHKTILSLLRGAYTAVQ